MDQDIIQGIITDRDITHQDTIGGLPGMCITGVLIGVTVTGGIIAGTGIEILKLRVSPQDRPDRQR
jgi:hypothetical protein